MRFAAVSALGHDGLLRDHNEDSLVVGPWTLCASMSQVPETFMFPIGRPLVVAVADGLGAHPAGALASTLVVQQLARVGPHLADERSVRSAIDECNKRVYEAADRDPRCITMGTTVAGVVLTADSVFVFNVGDSRVYACNGFELSRLSIDDSPPLQAGQTHTTIVTQTLGGYPSYEEIDTHVRIRPLNDAERYLVCSDGLSDVVDDELIRRLLSDHRGGRAVFELWKAAIAGGGPDNITLALVEVER
ncbi:PP2C family protein-serine/threonine phosphatase [Kribbella sp. NPDC050470]|uniref:PP2C family protein-serine/threonine phosphatase n=1 Tax=unclassified Kribbella TaxID=2644121 RepID=UPI00378BCEC1